LGQCLVRLVGAASQMPRRLLRVIHCGADDAMQPPPSRASQHGFGGLAQQRMAKLQHRIRGHSFQHARFQRCINLVTGRATRHSAQQGPRRRAGQRRHLHHCQRPRAEPGQTAPQRAKQRRWQLSPCTITAAAGSGLPGHLQRRIRASLSKRYDMPEHPR